MRNMNPDQPWRESVDVAGSTHGANPIPSGTRVGNMFFSSGILGCDAGGMFPADAAEQVRLAFENMDRLLAGAGVSREEVARVGVSLPDMGARQHVNTHWLARFPDPRSRPARLTVVRPLAGAMLVQLELIAVLKSSP